MENTEGEELTEITRIGHLPGELAGPEIPASTRCLYGREPLESRELMSFALTNRQEYYTIAQRGFGIAERLFVLSLSQASS